MANYNKKTTGQTKNTQYIINQRQIKPSKKHHISDTSQNKNNLYICINKYKISPSITKTEWIF